MRKRAGSVRERQVKKRYRAENCVSSSPSCVISYLLALRLLVKGSRGGVLKPPEGPVHGQGAAVAHLTEGVLHRYPLGKQSLGQGNALLVDVLQRPRFRYFLSIRDRYTGLMPTASATLATLRFWSVKEASM